MNWSQKGYQNSIKFWEKIILNHPSKARNKFTTRDLKR